MYPQPFTYYLKQAQAKQAQPHTSPVPVKRDPQRVIDDRFWNYSRMSRSDD